MDKEAFARGYEQGMIDLGVIKYAKGGIGAWDLVKLPLAAGVGVGTLGGILANYAHSYATTPTDADLEILENKALSQEAKRQTRGLKKLQEEFEETEDPARRHIRTGL